MRDGLGFEKLDSFDEGFSGSTPLEGVRRWTRWRPSAQRRTATRMGMRTTHAHHELGFWQKYIFSQDHKVIGIQYAITGLLFLLFGFSLMMIMRWQLAYPGRPDSAHRRAARNGQRARRHHAARVLQPARRHARHHHGVPRRRARSRSAGSATS